MILTNEALEEARRLTKVHNRLVEAKQINCDCDYHKNCGLCAGQGYYYELVFADCSHRVGDGELIECEREGCADRERSNSEPYVVKFQGEPIQSCAHKGIEESEAA